MESADQFLSRQLTDSDPAAIKLSTLAAEASESGIKPYQLNAKLFPLCSTDDIQKSWSHWNEVSEREEIRLRLMALNTHGSIHESLIPFLIFYFRSSDSILYQTAAQIIGKHLPYHAGLKMFLIDYMRERNVDPSVPINLNGIRSRRRILIALTSYCATHGSESVIHKDEESTDGVTISMPVDIRQLHNQLPENHLDLSALMLALSILQNSDGSKPFTDLALKLLTLPGNQDITIWDRNVIRNWGLLLNSTPDNLSEKYDSCLKFLQAGINHLVRSTSFSEKLQSFFELDETIKSIVHVPGTEELIQKLLSVAPNHADLIPFLKLQFNYWRLRETDLDAPFELKDQAVSAVMKIVAHSYRLPNGEFLTDTVAELLIPLNSEHEWRLQSINERVLRTFFILSSASQIHVSYNDEIQQMLSVIRPNNPDDFSGYRIDKVENQSLLDKVIMRLIELELTAKGQIPDGRLIQKITDENLLISLLPTDDHSDLLPILADAFEHRLRLLLASDSLFNVDYYLYKISIREPHQHFYRYMREITQDRVYGKSGEHPIDLNSRFLQLYQEKKVSSHNNSSEPSKTFPFWNSLEQIQNRLINLSADNHLFNILSSFTHELTGTGSDSLNSSSTLHDLINTTQQGSQRWIRSGFPSLWSHSATSINRRLSDLHQQMTADIQKLKPDRLENYPVAAEASHRLKDVLQEINHLLVPSLGKSMADVLLQITALLNRLLDQWTELLSETGESWMKIQSSGTSISDSHRNDIFQTISKEANSHLKMTLLSVFFSTLFSSNKNLREQSWIRQYHILSWAANKLTSPLLSDSESAEWKKNLVEQWKNMLNSAKEQNNEARVAQLVKAKEFQELRRDEEVQWILKSIKTWCFDRYDLNQAYICNRELFPQKNIIQNRWTTTKEFFAHFSYVWLALIVGVIMMFDFGDPWTELAEIGDVGGVIFTFVLGVGGTYLYVFADLRKKVKLIKGDPFEWASQFARVAIFLMITLIFTVMLVLLFYYMFSSTDQVVAGANAIWHIMSWTGFALFVGVFFGLIGKKE